MLKVCFLFQKTHYLGLVVSSDVACFSHLGSAEQQKVVKSTDSTDVRDVLGQTYCNMSLIYFNQGLNEKSLIYAEKSLDVAPSLKGHYRRASVLREMGDLIKARDEYERVLAWDPDNANAKSGLKMIDEHERKNLEKQKIGLKKYFSS